MPHGKRDLNVPNSKERNELVTIIINYYCYSILTDDICAKPGSWFDNLAKYIDVDLDWDIRNKKSYSSNSSRINNGIN